MLMVTRSLLSPVLNNLCSHRRNAAPLASFTGTLRRF